MPDYTLEELRQLIRDELTNALVRKSLNDDLLTREEAAVFLGIKPQTLAVWATKGIGPAPSKVGGRAKYRRSVLEAYVSSNTMPR